MFNSTKQPFFAEIVLVSLYIQTKLGSTMNSESKKDIYDLLKKYWGYNEFRPLQADIIQSVLSGQDTLALMPTGGGKSITYQVSALALDGLCVVVTPLIALMKDQIEDLLSRDVAAVAIYTGMSHSAILSALNRISGGKVKFLYISPERLESVNFRQRIQLMNISMIAVDEAHCISQWGYDFRPSYLKIAEIRNYFPDAPILALTATATSDVIKDIQNKLMFRKENVFSKSFRRSNIIYVVREIENRLDETVHILKKVNECSIVYVRTRQNAEEVAQFLSSKGLNVGFYHAGLSSIQRENRQNAWKNNDTQIIVATNAFGMGIDKPDVRVVIHYDIPDSPEAYFQEAGRAGRDNQRAYAVLLYNQTSLTALKQRVVKAFPEKAYIKTIYTRLADFFQIEEGNGEGMFFEFDMDQFVKVFKLDYSRMLAAVNILQVGGYLECTTDINSSSRVTFLISRDKLSSIEFSNSFIDIFIEYLLRNYAGLFTQYVYLNEQHIADLLQVSQNEIYHALLQLARQHIIAYIPGNDRPYIIYRRPRLPLSYIDITKEAYEFRKQIFCKKIEGITNYIENKHQCRQLILMEYFDQKEHEPCGVCDNCLTRDKKSVSKLTNQAIDTDLYAQLKLNDVDVRDFTLSYRLHDRNVVINRIRQLLDEEVIYYKTPTLLAFKIQNS